MRKSVRGFKVLLAGAVALSLACGVNGPSMPSAAADPPRAKGPATQKLDSTPGRPVRPTPRKSHDAAAAAARVPVQVPRWPSASTSTVSVAGLPAGTARRAGTSPISIGVSRSAARTVQPASVTVRVLGQDDARRRGVTGLVFGLSGGSAGTVRSATPVRARVQVSYADFAQGYGGDWASRLRLVRLTCTAAACSQGDLAAGATNNLKARVVEGEVALTQDGAESWYALAAGAAGANGSYEATSLAPSSAWQVSKQTGDFTWSYPLRVPPGTAGPKPELGIAYTSGSVDGQTASTNNQPSWIGQGHQLAQGFVERKYLPCADDMTGGNNATKTGDLCWKSEDGEVSDNVVLSLGGRSTELIKVKGADPEQWRLREDDGSRIEREVGATNGARGGEYWVLTTSNGTKHYFGLNPVAYAPARTNSVSTVPVFGNHANEQCHGATFAASYCQQAWRWSLDRVVDTSGNIMTYRYQQEDNFYGRNNNDGASEYQRASYLTGIEYGERPGSDTDGPPPAWVTFNTYERCSHSAAVCEGPLNASTAVYWPDVPFDQICASSTTCPGKTSPSFFSRKRLTSITTHIWDDAVRTVDVWTFVHDFPDPGDGTSRALWLKSITHRGTVGGDLGTPAISFTGAQMANRVDNYTDGAAEMNKWRIVGIKTESGAAIDVDYLPKHCSSTSKPAHPAGNGMRCMPVYWTKPLDNERRLDWFHKYPVSVVHEDDLVTDAPLKTTNFEYVGAPAWHYDDNELTLPKYRTWSDWRGYQTVNVKVGSSSPTQTRYTYFRGMHGDRKASGDPLPAEVADSTGVEHVDHARLNGFVLEQITYNGAGGPEVTGTINLPWISGATGSDGKRTSTLLGTGSTRIRQRISEDVYRITGTNTEFDSLGFPVKVDDHGDVTTFADDRCKRVVYTRNATAWITATVNSEQTVSQRCSETPNLATHLVSEVRSYYDGHTDLVAPPSRGLVSKVEAATEWTTGAVFKQRGRTDHDVLGRVVATYDGTDRKTSSTAYTPAASGPVTSIAFTNAKNHTTTQTLEPALGLPTSSVDPNGGRTDLTYDPLGRITAVWLPGRSKATGQTASMQYAYKLSQTAPSVVTTKTLLPSGAYKTAKTLHDGFLKKRQVQSPTATGVGRMLTDTRYNDRGGVRAITEPYYDSSVTGANDTLFHVSEIDIPAETEHAYDGADRQTVSIFQVRNAERWRTTTTYGVTYVATTPPAGGTATATILDPRGRTTELREYNGPLFSPTYNSTRYTYTERDELATVSDARGSIWRYSYDMVGRKLSSADPDKGTSTSTYDNADRVVTTRDARGVVLHNSYDELDRKTAVREDSATGPLRASWVYDTLAKGYPTSSTRHVGDDEYVSTVTGYDDAYRPEGTSLTIPAAEGKLAGTYTESSTYLADGSVKTRQLPNSPGVPAETLMYTYNAAGYPDQMGGYGAQVAGTSYLPNGKPVQYDLGPTIGKAAWQTFTYETGTERLASWRVNRENLGGEEYLAYSYDNAGNVKGIAQNGYGAVDRQCFTTDFLRRITEAWTPSGGTCTTAPNVNELGGPVPYWQSFRYSAAGDRAQHIDHKATGNTTRTHTYPASNLARPHGVTSVVSTGPAGTKTDSYGYDAVGNLSSRTEGGVAETLTWDDEGHLSKVAGPGGETSFLYDASGARLIRRDPQGATLYLGSTEVRWDKATDTVSGTRFYEFNGQTVMMRTGLREAAILFVDPHGTAQIGVDAYDGAYSRRRMDPFGNIRQTGGPWEPTAHGFVDGVIDASTRLTHLGAREYDPKLGRFISVDPIIDPSTPQQMNGYAYGNNNPPTFPDPTGLMWNGDPEFESSTHGGEVDGNPTTRPRDPEPQAVKHRVRRQVGVTMVDAPDEETFDRVLRETQRKPRYARPRLKGKAVSYEQCTSSNTMIAWGSYGQSSCGGAFAMWATDLGKEMCKAPGMMCDAGDGDLQTLGKMIALGGLLYGGRQGGTAGEKTGGAAKAARTGWSTGDDIYALTRAGNAPAWSTVRGRFWKNEAANPQYGSWSGENLARMERGLAPQRFNRKKGGMESMDLSHEPVPLRSGGTSVIPRWPQDHARIDPFRRPGY